MNIKDFKRGAHDSLPIALGYISVSFTFGLMAVSSGLSGIQAVLISMTNLTSAGQFAGLDIMIASGTFIEMALTQLIINIRYALMSLALSQKLDSNINVFRRALIGFGITDEIFAVSMVHSQKENRPVTKQYMYGMIVVPYFAWAGGTALGAWLGLVLPHVIVVSAGIAIYGMFIAIIIPKSCENKKYATAVISAAVLGCVFKFVPYLNKISSGFVIIIIAVIVSAFAAYFDVKSQSKDQAKISD